jgi:hypothetical protein
MKRRRVIWGGFLLSLVLTTGLSLVACSAQTADVPSSATSTPWPTLAPLMTVSAQGGATALFGPQLVDKYRADLQEGVEAAFPLEGRADRPVRIEVIVLLGEIDPIITLRNPAGHQLARVDRAGPGEPEVIGQFQFPEDGYYELDLSTVSGTGQVGVSIYELDVAQLEGGGAFSSMNQEIQGSIRHPATYHTFRLPVQRGQRFDLSATALTEGLDLLFDLYGPDGTLLASRDDNVGKDPYLWNFMPSQSGTYTVVLSNYDQNVGDYVLRVSPSESGGQAAIGVRTGLELAAAPRRSTWLTFEGLALDAVYIEARPATRGVDPVIALYDQFGNRLVAVNQYGPDQQEQATFVQLPFDGQYQVEFSTLGEGGQIQYYIRSIRQADIDVGGRITPGMVAHKAEMEGTGCFYVYVFDIQGGELIGIDAHATGGTGLDLGFNLYTPDGYLLVTRDDVVGRDPVLDRIELTQPGRYVLAVWNYGNTTGPFELYVTNPAAPSLLPGTPAPG